MPAEPMGYRLEWKPGDPCHYTPEDYAREGQRAGADVWGLFAEPQPDCPPEIAVYLGWCWVQPRYVSAVRDLTGFTPLYLGPLIQRGTIPEAVAYLFPRIAEERLHQEHPELWGNHG